MGFQKASNGYMKALLFVTSYTSSIAIAQDTMKMPPESSESIKPSVPHALAQKELPVGILMMGSVKVASSASENPSSVSLKSSKAALGETFSTDPTGLQDARPMEVLDLSEGAQLTLEVAPVRQKIDGVWARRLAYNSSVPGPVIKVQQGSTLKLVVVNKSDVETTLHPHGLRIDEKNDGVVGIGQPSILPGKSFDYALTFPDVGMFWYHAHVQEDYTQDAGLYGNFWVVPKNKNYYSQVHREVPLLIDDVEAPASAKPFYKNRSTHSLTGRFGDVMLINGSSDFTLSATEGEVVRLFLTNTANTRTLVFAIPGLWLKVVGSDNGLFERETWAETVTLAPSERSIIEVKFLNSGVFEMVNSKPVGSSTRLGKILVQKGQVSRLASSFDTLRAPPESLAALKTVRTKLGLPVTHALRFDVSLADKGMAMKPSGESAAAEKTREREKNFGIEWEDPMAEMNAASDDKSVVWKLVEDSTGRENMDIKWAFEKGDFVKIRLVNDPQSDHPMQHPIHFHGQRFVVAATNGKLAENLVWKDSVLVPEGDTIEIILELTNVGRWLAHCHISEHLSAGMVMGFTVSDPVNLKSNRR